MRAPGKITRYGLGTLIAISLIGTLVSFAFPLMVSATIDRVIPHKAFSTLYVIILCLIVAGMFEALITMLRGQVIAFKATEQAGSYGEALINTLFRLPNTELLGESGRKITAQIVPLNLYRTQISDLITFVINVVFSSCLFAAALFLMNRTLFVAILAGFAVHFLIYFALRPMVKPIVRLSLNQYERFVGDLQSKVQAIETLRAFGLSRRAADGLLSVSEEAFRQGMAASRATMTAAGASKFASRSVEACIIFLGASAVMQETMTLGELVAFQMFAARLFDPLTRLPNAWEQYQQISEYRDRWSKILSLKTLPVPKREIRFEPSNAPALAMHEVSFRYEGCPPILEKFSLQIDQGEIVFMLGPSGSGKSTLVRLLTGLLEPQAGRIEVMGHDLEQIDEAARKLFVACAFQEPVLLPGTIAENISAFDASVDRARVVAAALTAGAASFIGKLPGGFDTIVGAHGIELSGGEKQRLCLARMLAADSGLMILDEATTGLERELEIGTLKAIIGNRRPHQAILIITHREDLAELGTRCIRLDGGRIVSDRPRDPGRQSTSSILEGSTA